MSSGFSRLALASLLLAPIGAWPQVSISISIAPPMLPVYEQPVVPGDGYLWMPGYWAWGPDSSAYFWVPGTWVLAPQRGHLWTPGYWAFEDTGYRWHTGYWGRRVGYYGGVNYGYGYGGSGYQGGRWDRDVFRYNRAVTHVDTTIVHNVYNTRVVNNYNVERVSYHGGPAGTRVRPTSAERQFERAPHTGPTPDQVQHERTALTTPTQRAVNGATGRQGAIQVAATPHPSAFTAPGVEKVRERGAAAPPAVVHAPPPEAMHRPAPPAQEAVKPVAHAAPAPAERERKPPPARGERKPPPAAHDPAAPDRGEAKRPEAQGR